MPATQISEAEVDALVSRITELERLLTERDEADRNADHESQIASLRSEHEVAVAEVRRELDATTLSLTQVTQERDNILAWLQGEADRQAEERERDARRDSRVAAVREVATFPDDYVERNTDRWAALSDEAFEALLADYQAMPGATGAPVITTGDLAGTALTAAATHRPPGRGRSPLSGFYDLCETGVDLRNIGASTGGAR